MIIREWRARAPLTLAHAYPKHFETRVVPELGKVWGFLGASLGQRRIGQMVEFLVLTRWESIEAIRRFTGADTEKAVVEPAAQAALAAFDGQVRHYEVLHDSSSTQASIER